MIGKDLIEQRWFGAVVLAAVLLLVFGFGVGDATAHLPRHSNVATIAGHGLRLTIRLPRPVYPPDALVPVTVTLRNVSNRPVPIMTSCGAFLPSVTEFDASGRVVYPPGIPDLPPHPTCDVVLPPQIMPSGTTWSWDSLEVLRGRSIRAGVEVASSQEHDAPTRFLQTPALTVGVTRPVRTGVRLTTSPHLDAVVTRHPHVPVYYSDRVTCAAPFNSVGGTPGWQRLYGSTIRASIPANCPVPIRWQLVVAAQGQPPERFDWKLPLPPVPAGGEAITRSCVLHGARPAGTVAFAWRGHAYLAGSDGACRFSSRTGVVAAQMAPSGRELALVARTPGKAARYGIWLATWPDGTPMMLMGRPAVVYRPDVVLAWSPGGKRLAFASGGITGKVSAGGFSIGEDVAGPQSITFPVAWLPNGSAAAQLLLGGPSGRPLTMQVAYLQPSGGLNSGGMGSGSVDIRFPGWIYHPRRRPVGSLPRQDIAFSADGRHVIVATSGGGTSLSGIWEAPAMGGDAHLIAGTRARVNGYQRHGTHLDGATHIFGSPNSRYVIADSTAGFWVIDTRTLHGRLIPVRHEKGCVVTQEGWASGRDRLAFVRTCGLDRNRAFRSELWETMLGTGESRRLVVEIDRVPNAIRIGPVSRFLIWGVG